MPSILGKLLSYHLYLSSYGVNLCTFYYKARVKQEKCIFNVELMTAKTRF